MWKVTTENPFHGVFPRKGDLPLLESCCGEATPNNTSSCDAELCSFSTFSVDGGEG